MTTGHSPSSADYDATTALSRFASPQDLERIAETRPDLHSILATNPSIPPQVRTVLEQSDDPAVQEVLARQAGRGAPQFAGAVPPAQPAQPQVPGQIDPMAPTMAVGTQPQQAAAGAGYGQSPQGYGSVQPTTPGAVAQGDSAHGAAPQGYGYGTVAQPQQSPLPQVPSQEAQSVALPPPSQRYSAPSMQSAAQPMDQQPAMPPGVRVGAPPEQAQGHSQGQFAAPAYGAPMYAPPAQPQKRRGFKVLAIVLPIALLLTGGSMAAWYFLWRSNVSSSSPFVSPSGAWVNGADKTWSADVAANKEPYVAGHHFLTLDRSDGTLTGYTALGSNMKEAWQTTLDDEDLKSPYGPTPSFQTWGDDTLVYKSTLIDLQSGDASSAPWGDEKSAIIADDIAISCKASDKCTAWDSQKQQKWTREIPGAGEMSSSTFYNNQSVLTRGNQRYTWLYNVVINIDSGETLILGGGSKADPDLMSISFKDGWGTFEEEKKDEDSDSNSDSSLKIQYKATIYDFKGEKQSSYTVTFAAGERVVLTEEELLTAEEYRTYFKDQDLSEATLTSTANKDGCVTKLNPKKGKSISVPQPEDSSTSSYDSDSPTCASGATVSQDGGVVKLTTWNRGDVNSMQMLMNVKTGREITFSGIDWKSGDSLIVAKPDLIIGYDKNDGKVIGFKPES